MLNFKNKLHIISIFSILYIIGLLCGIFFQNIFYFFILTGIFIIIGVWVIYLLTNNSEKQPNTEIIENTQQYVNSEQTTEIKNIKNTPNQSQPNEIDEIYEGEFIDEETFKDMENERKTWYDDTNKRIEESLSDLKKLMQGEEIEHGKE